MGFLTSITDFFKSKPASEARQADKYGVLDPLMSTIELVRSTKDYVANFNSLQIKSQFNLLTARASASQNRFVKLSNQTYLVYLKALDSGTTPLAARSPGEHLAVVLEKIALNLEDIERHHVRNLQDATVSVETLNLSSLVLLGYIKKSADYATWVMLLLAALYAEDEASDRFTPHQMELLTTGAVDNGRFASLNALRWGHPGGLVNDVATLKKRGLDVAVKNGDIWLDELVDDRSLTAPEQMMITAGFVNPIGVIGSASASVGSWYVALLNSRREWIVTRMTIVQAKSRGLDETSPEYQALRKTLAKYADQITKLERQIARG